MRTFITAIFLLVLSASPILAKPLATLPVAPSPVVINAKVPRVFTKVDWTLAADVIAVNALDFTSTERGLAHPDRFREVILPQSLVRNEAGFAAFKVATTSLELFGQWELERRGHRKLARIAQAAVIGFTLRTDIHNYQIDSTQPVAHGLQPIHAGTPLR